MVGLNHTNFNIMYPHRFENIFSALKSSFFFSKIRKISKNGSLNLESEQKESNLRKIAVLALNSIQVPIKQIKYQAHYFCPITYTYLVHAH